jgi:DNA-binding transcriptional ArsR family regulator
MSRRPKAGGLRFRRPHAQVFAALGDETRLSLVGRLGRGEAHSISELSKGSRLTRQAITKHLRVLQDVNVVHSVRRGRNKLFTLTPEPIEEARKYLELVSRQRGQVRR